MNVWLIELRHGVTGKPSWYGMGEEGSLGITEDPYKAVRFSRKTDAVLVMNDIGWTEADAVEHGFDD